MNNTNIPNQSPKLQHTNQQVAGSAVNMAAFIVGCLVFEDVIPLDVSDSGDSEMMRYAIRIVAACLVNFEVDRAGRDAPILPFEV